MSPAGLRLFQRIANGSEQAAVLDATIAEVVYVLSSRSLYGLPREDIRDRLQSLLAYRALRVEHKTRCLAALDLYVRYPALSFGDALIAAAALDEPPYELYSYDRGFDRVAGVVRVEP
jgi:predicted nucleic acid-binding protein